MSKLKLIVIVIVCAVLMFGAMAVVAQDETPAPQVTEEFGTPPPGSGYVYMDINGTMMWVEPTRDLNGQINAMDYYINRMGEYVATLSALESFDTRVYSPMSVEAVPSEGGFNWALFVGGFAGGFFITLIAGMYLTRQRVTTD